jgi:hypothetical protein
MYHPHTYYIVFFSHYKLIVVAHIYICVCVCKKFVLIVFIKELTIGSRISQWVYRSFNELTIIIFSIIY